VEGVWQTLASSTKLRLRKKYSAYNIELVAIYEGVRHFRHLLEALF
jgi:hypothetical protein